MRGIDRDQHRARRSTSDSDEVRIPKPSPLVADEGTLPRRVTIVPGERSGPRAPRDAWAQQAREMRRTFPMARDEHVPFRQQPMDEDVVYTGKHDRHAPVARSVRPESWLWGRAQEFLGLFAFVVMLLILVAVVYIVVFTDWVDGFWVWVMKASELDGL